MDIYDLTHFIEEDMTAYTEEEKGKIFPISTVNNDGYNVLKLELSTHTGTHIDGPKHLFEDGISLEEILKDKFIGNGFIIDCRNKKEIDLKFLLSFEEEIKNTNYLILRTGFEEFWNKEGYFNGYGTLTLESVEFLSNLENLWGIGVDAISVDKEEDLNLNNHKILLKNNKIIIENLCNLHKLEDKFKLILAPLKIKNGDGASARVLATP